MAGRYSGFGAFMLCVMAAARSVSPGCPARLQYVRIQGPVYGLLGAVRLPTLVPIPKERSPSSHAADSVSAFHAASASVDGSLHTITRRRANVRFTRAIPDTASFEVFGPAFRLTAGR